MSRRTAPDSCRPDLRAQVPERVARAGLHRSSAQESSRCVLVRSRRGHGPGYLASVSCPPKRWTESETGGLDTPVFSEPDLIHYKSFDGRRSRVRLPPRRRRASPAPAGADRDPRRPRVQFRPGFLGRLNYLINELGLVLICPTSAARRATARPMSSSTTACCARTRSRTSAPCRLGRPAARPRPGRVGVSGGSYGGYMSLAVPTPYNDRIRRASTSSASRTSSRSSRTPRSYRRDLGARVRRRARPAMREFLERISPLASADKIHTPLLVVQGKNDPRVPVSEAEQIVAAVKERRARLVRRRQERGPRLRPEGATRITSRPSRSCSCAGSCWATEIERRAHPDARLWRGGRGVIRPSVRPGRGHTITFDALPLPGEGVLARPVTIGLGSSPVAPPENWSWRRSRRHERQPGCGSRGQRLCQARGSSSSRDVRLDASSQRR